MRHFRGIERFCRCTLLRISKAQPYFLASRFQPKPEKQSLSYEEYRSHPSERLKFRKNKHLENVTNTGEGINIGFKVHHKELSIPHKSKEVMKQFEEDSRLNRMSIDIKKSFTEFCEGDRSSGVKNVFRYYDIFTDLFGGAEFTPVMPLNVDFDQESSFYGNILKPIKAGKPPKVSLELTKDVSKFFWSLIMTCPDEHLTEIDAECLHWVVSNIPHDAASSECGTYDVEYLPPIPYRGTGFHRYVILAFYHQEKIEFSDTFFQSSKDPLESRTFSTMMFYQQFQDKITPLTASFFQAEWDRTVSNTFRSKLGMEEPAFEWDSPPRYIPSYERFPRFADISHFEQYSPSFYTRTGKNSFLKSSWDKMWNTGQYRDHVVGSLAELDQQRIHKVLRQDYFRELISEEENYERELTKILKQYTHEDIPKPFQPKRGLLY